MNSEDVVNIVCEIRMVAFIQIRREVRYARLHLHRYNFETQFL